MTEPNLVLTFTVLVGIHSVRRIYEDAVSSLILADFGYVLGVNGNVIVWTAPLGDCRAICVRREYPAGVSCCLVVAADVSVGRFTLLFRCGRTLYYLQVDFVC